MNSEIEETDNNETSRFKIVAERAFFWNFIANVVVVFLVLVIITFKPAGNPLPDTSLNIILNFLTGTTYVFAGTYIAKFLKIDVNTFWTGIHNAKNLITRKEETEIKPRGKK